MTLALKITLAVCRLYAFIGAACLFFLLAGQIPVGDVRTVLDDGVSIAMALAWLVAVMVTALDVARGRE